MYEVTVTATISASHKLRGYMGKCENLHGHNYKVEVTVGQESLDEIGLALDFGVLKARMKQIIDRFDHADLNQLDEFRHKNPSSENLAKVIYDTMSQALTDLDMSVLWVRVHETEGNYVTYHP